MGKGEGVRPMPSVVRQTEQRRNMAVRRRPSHGSRVGAAGQVLLQGRLVADGREVRMRLCLLRCQTFLHHVGQRGVAQSDVWVFWRGQMTRTAWSYRSSLSKKSMASLLTNRWFSELTKLCQGFFWKRPRMSSYWASSSISYLSR